MNKIIFILSIIFVIILLLFLGLQAIYYGIYGLINKKIPLFLKEHFSTNKDFNKLNIKEIKDVDIATGKYAVFWSIIYLFTGILLCLTTVIIIYFITISLFK